MRNNPLKTLAKSAAYTKLAKEGIKLARKQIKQIDWDADTWLHRVGLTTYKPARFSFGGFGLFMLGAAAGAVVGLALAPKPGVELRTEVRERANEMWKRQQGVGASTETTAQA